MKIKEILKNIFLINPDDSYNFTLGDDSSISNKDEKNLANNIGEEKNIFPSIDVNLEYVKVKYNAMINSDIVLREFMLTARNKQYRAFLLFIDGMVDTDLINNYVLKPLMMKNLSNSFDGNQDHIISEAVTNNITVRKVKKFDIVEYISNCLFPQNDIKKKTEFSEIFSGVNSRKLCTFHRYSKYRI